jgi:pimeloyl-ACP methyl ester carboxylesterase
VPTPLPVQYVQANGIRFAYFSEGEGPLALLFHGFPDTPHTWDFVRPKIAAKGYRVVTPFLRGYRPSEVPSRDADGETIARDAVELIGALGEATATLIGHDWGAGAVYGATAIAPEKVTKLIAIGIPHPATLKPSLAQVWGVRHFGLYKLPGAPARFAKDDFAALPKILRRWSPDWSPTAADMAAVRECYADPSSLNAAFGYYRTLKFSPEPFQRKRIAVPTVVFSGTGDPNAHRSDYERGRRMFDGEYVIEEMPGGHFMHLEHPEVFAELLLKHL